MNILKNTIKIGLNKPVGLLHITDTHFPQYDPNDESVMNARKNIENQFCALVSYAKNNDLLLIHTGDFMTFCNEENCRMADKYLSGLDYCIAIGNHDFCHEGGNGDAVENVDRNTAVIAPHFAQNLYFDTKIINGELNIVTLNNAFFQIDSCQIELLKKESAKGFPIILCMHIPIFSPDHAKARMQLGNCAHLLGVPDELLDIYPAPYKFHKPNETTLQAIQYIKNETAIKAVIAGHTHMNYEEELEGHTLQFVTSCGSEGCARVITVE